MVRIRKYVSALIISVILALLVSCSEYSSEKGQVYIMGVGIDYKYTNAVSDLDCCVNDASDIIDSLQSIYDRMGIDYTPILMICSGTELNTSDPDFPSSSKILAKIENLEVNKNDTIVFYYSGHGHYVDQSYLCAADETKTSFTDLAVNDLISAFESKNCPCTVIIDACYCGSDYAQGKQSGFVDSVMSLVNKVEFSKIAVLASSSKEEKSYGSIGRNSKYTEKILETLEDVRGPLTAQDLFKMIDDKVSFSSQTPEVNWTESNVYFIPRKTIIF